MATKDLGYQIKPISVEILITHSTKKSNQIPSLTEEFPRITTIYAFLFTDS